MPEPIITVQNLTKKFIISHEAPERYKSLREVVTNRFKKLTWKGEKRFSPSSEEFLALDDVSFDVYPGDRLGIIGRNGAGKSTMLKILSRITEPSGGRITIKGKVSSLLEVGTGFHPELTGRENIFLNGAILGMSRAEIRKKFDEIVDFAEVEKFLDTPVKRYSSGMYVRLAFAVAAFLEPEILIVDEVLSVGDAQFQKKCLGKMEDVSKNQGRTVLFVSHNMGVIAQLCNKAIFLTHGKITNSGNVQDVISSYLTDNNNSQQTYIFQESSNNLKTNYFTKIYSTNYRDESALDFTFDEKIKIKFDFVVKEVTSGLQIGIALQNKFNSRIFTVIREIEYFKKNSDNLYHGEVLFPESLIAPNNYSFVLAIWTKDGRVYDMVENILFIKIHDNGTYLANYEGIDYGSIIINPEWQ